MGDCRAVNLPPTPASRVPQGPRHSEARLRVGRNGHLSQYQRSRGYCKPWKRSFHPSEGAAREAEAGIPSRGEPFCDGPKPAKRASQAARIPAFRLTLGGIAACNLPPLELP